MGIDFKNLRGVATLALLGMTISIGACSEVTATVAERCVLVDLQQERGRELLPLLEGFARAQDLAADLSSPATARFYRGAAVESDTEIIYTMGMGEFGAALSVFRFDSEQDLSLVVAFDDFIAHQVAPRYSVTSCSEVAGFQLPVVFR